MYSIEENKEQGNTIVPASSQKSSRRCRLRPEQNRAYSKSDGAEENDIHQRLEPSGLGGSGNKKPTKPPS